MVDTTTSAGHDQSLSPHIPIFETHKISRRPRDPPSVIDWEHFRPVIIRLYLDKSYTLSAVQHKLAGSLGFKASKRTYKVKLRQWGIHKNHRPSQENFANDMASACTIEQSTNRTNTVSKRVFDHKDSDGSEDQESEDQSVRSVYVNSDALEPEAPLETPFHRSNLLKVARLNSPTFQDAEINLSHELVSCSSLETVLLSTQLYLELVLGKEIGSEIKSGRDSRNPNASHPGYNRIVTKRSWRRTEYLWSKFHHGLSLLEERKIREGFESLHQGCNLAQDFLSQQSRHCLSSLFIHMGNHRWSRHAAVRRSLLRFLFRMSSNMFGRRHPLSIIIFAVFKEINLINDYAELALKVMLDMTTRHVNAANGELLRIKMCFCVILERQQEHMLSEALIESTCYQSEQQGGRTSAGTRQCLRRLAILRAGQGRLEEAVTIFEDVIRRQPQFSKLGSPDELNIYTYRNLAMLCAKQGNFAKSDYWFKKELDTALIKWGSQDEYYINCCAMRSLRLQNDASGFLGLDWLEIT